MKEIVLRENFAFVYLNKNIYSFKAIKSSITTYSEFFEATFNELGNYTVIKIQKTEDNKYSIETLAREFLNYLISEEHN